MSKLIINYLDYLKEASKEIQGQDILKVLSNEKRFIPNPKHNIDKKNKEFKKIYEPLILKSKVNNNQLFIGHGKIEGKIKGGKKDKYIASPLIFMSCKILPSREVSDSMYIDKHYGEIHINVKLIFEINKVANSQVNIFEIINKLESYINDIQKTEIKYAVRKIYATLKEEKIFISKNNTEVYDLSFDENEYMFISSSMNALSMYEEIGKLQHDISTTKTNDNTIINLLKSAILGNPISNLSIDSYVNYNEIIEQYIPLPLSNIQRQAISNAFQAKLSYIQGPPGTGKSYTISSIVLSAIFHNPMKKILVLSHREPALDVVEDFTKEFLIDMVFPVGLIYLKFDDSKEPNIKLLNHIRKIISLGENHQEITKIINTLIEDEKNYTTQLIEEQKQLSFHLEKLTVATERLYRFEEKSKSLISHKKFLEFNYQIKIPQNLSLTNNINFDKLYKAVKLLKHLEDKNKSPKAMIYRNKITLLFLKKLNAKKEWFEQNYIANLLEDYLKYCVMLVEIDQINPSVDINRLRILIKNYKDNIKTIQKRLLTIKYKKNIFKFIPEEKYIIELKKLLQLISGINKKITSAEQVKRRKNDIDFELITDILPFWAIELKHIGRIMPMKGNLFDLVIIDEASQVNLIESFPALYRGKNICIVGDHQQLDISSTKIQFDISGSFDEYIWTKYIHRGYEYGKEYSLVVSKASILKFVINDFNSINLKRTVLNEHYRSLPALSYFTQNFYEYLSIMTDTSDKIFSPCFRLAKVRGHRDDKGIIKAEAKKVIELIRELIESININNKSITPQILTNDFVPLNFSLGVISIMSKQVNLIDEMLHENISGENISQHKIIVGTPEQLQGHERDIIIFSLCADNNTSPVHYENVNRFNVATSRAKKFLIFVYSGIPRSFKKYRKYIRHFIDEQYISEQLFDDSTEGLHINGNPKKLAWKFNSIHYRNPIDFEVSNFLKEYLNKYDKRNRIKLFNEVKSCGENSLEFVLYHKDTKKSVLVEIDGYNKNLQTNRNYVKNQIRKNKILEKMGWKVLSIPYNQWFKNGEFSLQLNNHEKENIFKKISFLLEIKFIDLHVHEDIIRLEDVSGHNYEVNKSTLKEDVVKLSNTIPISEYEQLKSFVNDLLKEKMENSNNAMFTLLKDFVKTMNDIRPSIYISANGNIDLTHAIVGNNGEIQNHA